VAIDVVSGAVRPVVTGPEPFSVYPAPRGDAFLWGERPARRAFTLAGGPPFHQTLHLHDADGHDAVLTTLTDSLGCEARAVWAPDGGRFAVVQDGAVLLWEAARVEAGPERLAPGEGARARDGALYWTADGAAVVVWGGRRLWRLPVSGAPGQPLGLPGRAITGLLHHGASGRLPPGELTVFSRGEAGHAIHRLPSGDPVVVAPAGTTLEGQPFSDVVPHSADATPDGSVFVYVARTASDPGDRWVARAGGRDAHQVTHLNPRLREIAFGWHARFPFRTAGGRQVHAGILLPPGWSPGHPCPTVLSVYPGGFGSEGMHHIGAATVLPHQLLAALGFAVLAVDIPYDPRVDDPVAVTVEAALPAAEEAVRLGYADPDRLAIAGGSLGGYAVLSTIVRTTRFRAAIAVSGVADLVSNYGSMLGSDRGPLEDDGEHWGPVFSESGQLGMGGPPWERPLRYVHNSPLFFLDRIQTPLLLIAGAKDPAVPWTQWGEVFVGMRHLGKRCTLLLYPEGGHGIGTLPEPEQRDAAERVIAFLAEHLGH
jgi:dipeptidyl aminopeptidase/acylaminoacyl peptidase